MLRIYSTILKFISSLFPHTPHPVPYSQQQERARVKAKREAAKVIFSGMLVLCLGTIFLCNSILAISSAEMFSYAIFMPEMNKEHL